MKILQGTSINTGIVFGTLKYFSRDKVKTDQYKVSDPEAEIKRFEAAKLSAMERLRQLHDEAVEKMGEENAQLFETHQMMLDDLDYSEAIIDLIHYEKWNAEYAVLKTTDKFADMFLYMDDEYMQARAADVRDVSSRVVDILAGKDEQNLMINQPIILAADDLLPSETAQLDRQNVLAIVTSKGSPNSHTAIFARSMGIPAVIAVGSGLNSELDGKCVAMDAGMGTLFIEPDGKTTEELEKRKKAKMKYRALLESYRGKQTVTKDGRKIMLYANIGSPDDLDTVMDNDAEGIGLFRSEFLYLGRNDFPSEDIQFKAYKEVAERMGGRRVLIRTLDIGADKQAEYFNLLHEDNPAMGMRAIRICLTRPDVFKTQLRALYRASAYGRIAIMFPMITSPNELTRVKAIVTAVKEELKAGDIDFDENVELGIMIETPSAAILSDKLANEVDFFSIGTNDLTQYTLACDRQNNAIAEFCDYHSEAVLRLIELTVKNAHQAGIWCGICGELGADETLTETFINMGIDELSVAPPMILTLREKIYNI